MFLHGWIDNIPLNPKDFSTVPEVFQFPVKEVLDPAYLPSSDVS